MQKFGIILSIFCFLMMSSCSGNRETKIEMPSEPAATTAMTEVSSVLNIPVETKKPDKEPVVRRISNNDNVIDGFEETSVTDIKFVVVKIGNDKYGVYTLNGIELSDFRMLDSGSYLLDIYDFNENNLICCVGDMDFLSGGIAGLDNSPRLVKINNRLPITIREIREQCVWIKDFDKYVSFKKGVWYADNDGDSLITSFYDNESRMSYYLVITDNSLSMYTDWNDLKF